MGYAGLYVGDYEGAYLGAVGAPPLPPAGPYPPTALYPERLPPQPSAALASSFVFAPAALVAPAPPTLTAAALVVYPGRMPAAPTPLPAPYFFAAPRSAVATSQFPAAIYPTRPPPQPFPRQYQSYIAAPIFIPGIPGVGTNGAATFVLNLEAGAKVTFGWGTDVFKSYNGAEQRSNTTGTMPRMRFEGSAYLLDGADRDTRSALMRSAASGATFLLALPYEALTLSADAAGMVLKVTTTANSDWATPGQRCVAIGPDGTTQTAVVQSTTATTIAVGAVDSSGSLIIVSTLGAAGKAGGRVMPLIQVLLDPQQGFARYPQSVDLWAIRAQAAIFGWAGQDRTGVGAQIATYTFGVPVDQSLLVDNDLLVWDRPNLSQDTESDGMASLAELVDLGALPFGAGAAPVPDWVRPIRYGSASAAEWQWFKAMLRQLLGRQRAFALPTNRPDLVPVSASGVTLKVQSGSVAGAGDYTAWYTSQAHRRFALTKLDGSVQYVAVTATPVDNGDGTLSLTLDAGVTGTVARVSLLEQVRFDNGDSDDFAVTWDGAQFAVELQARTLSQEVIVPPTLAMYDAMIDLPFLYGIGVPTPTDLEISIAPGKVTYVRVTSNRGALSFGGIQVTTAGGAQDGMVVTVTANSGLQLGLLHEDTSWPAGDRIWMWGRTGIVGTELSWTFVYLASVQRWVSIFGNAG